MRWTLLGGACFVFSLCFAGELRSEDLHFEFRGPKSDKEWLIASAENDVPSVVIVPDAKAADVVHLASALLAEDIGRVCGKAGTVKAEPTTDATVTILVGTLGDGGQVDQLVTSKKVDADVVRGKWESFIWQTVENPTPTLRRALVIIGSDRRGTAYGCTELSRAIGVSPWVWWADVPAAKHAQITLSGERHVEGSPGVQYRGIFINDEDFGFRPWASKTFDPELGNIGPKTYEKVFELMLRLRLNYLWPAMHPGSREFGEVPGNAAMADKWAIVMGASHCEPMLRNNVYWPHEKGEWRYDTNTKNIHDYWAESVRDRGQYEAVWTTGIRGIHDTWMSGPKEMSGKISMMESIFADQRDLLKGVSDKFGPVAQCFVPYKEVLPIYDAGLKVPDDITLIWPDDNFGYIRHLPNDAEQNRSGGNGIYYHVSYWGSPQSYLWLESISPGLMWEELHKAWEHGAKRIWVVNVGDIKPAEIAISFFSQLAWWPEAGGAGSQDDFLAGFVHESFPCDDSGEKAIGDLLREYYKLASIRKPDQIKTEWLDMLSPGEVDALAGRYEQFAAQEAAVAKSISPEHADAYFEMVGYAARMLAAAGQLYIHDAAARRPDHESDLQIAMQRMGYIEAETKRYNEQIAVGKWHGMISSTMQDVSWPMDVGGKRKPTSMPTSRPVDRATTLIDAAALISKSSASDWKSSVPSWRSIAGLGRSGSAVAQLPTTTTIAQPLDLSFDCNIPFDAAGLRIHFIPTLLVNPTGKLRVGVQMDDAKEWELSVPTAENNDESSGSRRTAVMLSRVSVQLPATPFPAGHHTLHIRAIDPGVVIDQLELPQNITLPQR